jgi:SAM-dependent methyltransferase
LPSPTEQRVLDAAAVLGILQRDGQGYGWTPSYATLDQAAWIQLVAIIEHQVSYLRLALNFDPGRLSPGPREQLESDATSYLYFLSGVDASHRRHAVWFARRPRLSSSRTLLDLGGGLGTFARAWVESRADRTGTVLDLPGLAAHVLAQGTYYGRLRAGDLDLTKFDRLPQVDAYLVANVLHLLPDWPAVLAKVAACMRTGALLAVLEASPSGPTGTLFDLQVHLRSGGRGSLLDPDDIRAGLTDAGLRDCSTEAVRDADDPFQRDYQLWIVSR